MVGRTGLVYAAMGGIFATVEDTLVSLRDGRKDIWNGATAGCAAGMVFGVSCTSGSAAVGWALGGGGVVGGGGEVVCVEARARAMASCAGRGTRAWATDAVSWVGGLCLVCCRWGDGGRAVVASCASDCPLLLWAVRPAGAACGRVVLTVLGTALLPHPALVWFVLVSGVPAHLAVGFVSHVAAPCPCRHAVATRPHSLPPSPRPFSSHRTAQKLSVGAGMCASLAATSAFLEAVNLTMGPTVRVPPHEKRTFFAGVSESWGTGRGQQVGAVGGGHGCVVWSSAALVW